MSVIKSNGAGSGASGGFYNGAITTSLRFPEKGGGYLSRTFDHNNSSSDWTFSTWIKRCQLTNWQAIFYSSSTGNPYYQSGFHWHSDDSLRYYHGSNANSGGGTHNITDSSAFFRDTSAWYHILIQRDNNGNTVSYVNGTQVASASSSSNLRYINGTTYPHYIGNYTYQSNPGGDFHGYMAETIFVDGSLVAPTSVAETKNGIWIPIKDPSLTYGENGFRLQYLQTGTSANSSGIGADTSGNDHHFTVTTLAAHDVVPDNPENNFATLMGDLSESQDSQSYYIGSYSQGNLKVTGSSNGWTNGKSNQLVNSGKWYAECRVNAWQGNVYVRIGVYGRPDRTYDEFFWLGNGTAQIDAADASSKVGTFTTGDILQIALDLENNNIFFGKNNTWQNSATAAEIAAGTSTNAFASGSQVPTGEAYRYGFYGNPHSTSTNITFNFGQDSSFNGTETAQGNADGNGIGDFYYSPPSGFLALCTANLPESTIGPDVSDQSDDHFNTVIYSGTGNADTITTGLQPDWIWIKQRNGTGYHNVTDTVRGITRELHTNVTDTETNYSRIASTSTTGFTFEDGANGYTNESGSTFVAWNWRAGGNHADVSGNYIKDGVAFTPTQGTMDANSMSVNTKAGFSIVEFTSNVSSDVGETGTPTTVAHSLGVKPEWVIIKDRDGGSYPHWNVWHPGYQPDTTYLNYQFIGLQNSNASNNAGWTRTDTGFTTNLFSTPRYQYTENGKSYIAYVFTPVEGFSRFGAYEGVGNTNGAFVFTGFRPAWVMTKRADSSGNWYINDTTRSTYNPTNVSAGNLYADLSNAEGGNGMDILSNGFKIRNTDSSQNTDGGQYVYMAFAETPFKFANAR